MRLAKILTLTAAGCLTTACSGSTPSADIQLDPPGEAVTAPCAGPVRLTADADTQIEQERLWARDRRALASCSARHRAAVAWIDAVLQAVSGD